MLFLLAFGLLITAATLAAVHLSRKVNMLEETDSLKDDLRVIAEDISRELDAGVDDPYDFLEAVSLIQKEDENFSYVLRDTCGIVISPSFVAGKALDMKDVHPYKGYDSVYSAHVWGYKCLVIIHTFPDRPLELVGIYSDRYIFDDIQFTVHLFFILVALVFAVLLAVAWLWVIPALERMYARRDRAEGELRIAHDLQHKAVTRSFPKDPRCDVHAMLKAMKDVGGDYYTCVQNGDKLFFALGDVSDKGTPAAFVMFLLCGVITSLVKHDAPLLEVMDSVNKMICDNPDYDMFTTLFIGEIDLSTLEMTYCNAGHTKTLLDGRFLDQDPQMIAGINPGFEYHTQTFRLQRGSRLLLYTDGVTEARNEAREFFGERRLAEWMQGRSVDESSEETCNALFEELSAFRGKAGQNDDIAIMCIKIC